MKYKRIMLKFSGEALAGKSAGGIDFEMLRYIVEEVRPLWERKIEVGIIIGGGNLFRGAELNDVNRVTGDQMGMLATIMNALALKDIFTQAKISCAAFSAFPVPSIICGYDRELADEQLILGKVVIFAGGTGNPLVTTDTALSLRGVELKADLLLKATNVDGIYSTNPALDKNAQFFSKLSYAEALANDLKVMDITSFCICRDHNMRLRVYNMHKSKALLRIAMGEEEGTLVTRNRSLS